MLLIKNIGTLQTPVGSFKHGGEKQGENVKLHNAAILVENGLIKAITEGGILPEGCETAEVIVNGVHCGKKIMPPWKFDIAPDLTENGELSLRLMIRNTPANRWEEVIPSGFEGPVRLIVKD